MAKVKANKAVRFVGVDIQPGERRTIDLEAAQLYTHTPLNIPVEVVNGPYAGPTLLVSAAIHGDELNGVEAARQLLSQLDVDRLKGTLVVVPVVNVFGFIHKSRYLPDRRDLNRCFPGSEKGSVAARIAHQFYTQIVTKCSHIIDLHTGAIHRSNLPQIRANLADPASEEMAYAFGAPVVIDSAIRDGSLRAVAEQAGIPVVTYEGGEALRFEPLVIASAVDGITKVMRHLDMLHRRRRSRHAPPAVARVSAWVRADQDGILRSKVALGDRVEQGQLLANVSAPLGQGEYMVIAPKGGIVIGLQTLPLVNEGDAIFHIAYFQTSDSKAEQKIETYFDEIVDQMDSDQLRVPLDYPPADKDK